MATYGLNRECDMELEDFGDYEVSDKKPDKDDFGIYNED